MMKKIDIHGISYIELLSGDYGWYWGSDYTHGDLYEAEELFKNNHSVKCNRLVFIHYPDGRLNGITKNPQSSRQLYQRICGLWKQRRYDAPNAVKTLKKLRKHPTPIQVDAIKDALTYYEVI